MANKHILIEIAFVIVVVAAAAHKRRLQNDKCVDLGYMQLLREPQ